MLENEVHDISKVNKGEENKNDKKNIIENIKSKKILKIIFGNLPKRKERQIIKYSKKFQNRLNISTDDYDDYFKTEIELIPEQNKYSEIINITDKCNSFYHIYFNGNKVETKKYYINKNDEASNIKIIIDHKLESFDKLFYYCSCIESIKFIKFFRNNIKKMSHMFCKCSSLIKLDLSNFNTNKVTDMKAMFGNCKSLKNLDLSNFVTDNVTDMGSMFNSCYSLEEIKLNSFNTENVKNMGDMFKGCSSLKYIDISNFKTNKVIYMYGMFSECSQKLIKEIKAQNKKIFDDAFS